MLTVSETAALLRTFDNVLILTHVRPDGDTVGCAAALCAGLRALGKAAYLLPNSELTNTTTPYFAPYAAPEDFMPEKVVSTDIATVGLFPENAKPYIGRIDLAIDHHPSFESFGKANSVRPEAAACGELMYDILANLGPIAYAGVLSGGVAYTLQLIGQRGLNPTAASLLMSLESVISALAGWVILGETLTGRELFGCVLVFCGVILAQLPAPEQLRKSKQYAAET